MKWCAKSLPGFAAWGWLIFILAVWSGRDAACAEDRIWLDANINGKSANIGFDTGSDSDFLFSKGATRLDVPIHGDKIYSIVNGENGTLRITKEFRLELFGETFKTSFVVIDAPEFVRAEADGFMGWPALKDSLFKIEANHGAVIGLERLPTDIANWTKLKIDTNSDVLRLEIPGPGKSPSVIFVDTGDEGGVSLPSARWQHWRAAHVNEPMTLRGYFTPGIGLVVAEEGWARELSVGPVLMSGVPVTEANRADERNGSKASIGKLGMAALRQLDFIVDGEHNVAYLRAKETPAAGYTHNRLGAVFVPPCQIAHVVQGGPAWQAGIRNGDLLTRVGESDLIKRAAAGAAISVNEIWKLPAGTKFKLGWKRGTNEFSGEVVLKEILHGERGAAVSVTSTRF